MAQLPEADLPSTVQGALKMIGQVSAFVKEMSDLLEQHEALRQRCERLEVEQEQLRQREVTARRESEETAEALAELRSAYEALIIEHETSDRALSKLTEEHDALLEGRRQIAEELGAVIGSLRTSRGSVDLGVPAAEA